MLLNADEKTIEEVNSLNLYHHLEQYCLKSPYEEDFDIAEFPVLGLPSGFFAFILQIIILFRRKDRIDSNAEEIDMFLKELDHWEYIFNDLLIHSQTLQLPSDTRVKARQLYISAARLLILLSHSKHDQDQIDFHVDQCLSLLEQVKIYGQFRIYRAWPCHVVVYAVSQEFDKRRLKNVLEDLANGPPCGFVSIVNNALENKSAAKICL